MPALLPLRGATEARPKRPALFAGRERERTLRTSTNRLVGSGYDAAGDQTGAGGGTFAYDAEGRMTSVTLQSPLSGTFTYGYDGEGRRVKRSLYNMANVYVYDAFGRLASEYRNGVWFKDFIYGAPASGRLFAMESTAQATSYVTVDALGSTRLVTGASRNVMARHDYLPFGKELLAGVGGRTGALGYGVDDRVLQRFTGQEVDPETGLDHFFFRYYSGRQGRFTTPDPLLAGDPANPQTWNRYAYVLNSPTCLTDPLGLCPPGTVEATTPEQVEAFVGTAMSFVTDPIMEHSPSNVHFDWKRGRLRIDCSGLVCQAMNLHSFGPGFSPVTTGLFSTRDVPRLFSRDIEGPARGDLILFKSPGHVGIVLSASPLVFVGAQSSGVATVNVPDNTYWQGRVTGQNVSFYRPCVPAALNAAGKRLGDGSAQGRGGRPPAGEEAWRKAIMDILNWLRSIPIYRVPNVIIGPRP